MRSLIDSSKMVIYPNQCVLSLIAKAKGKNPEHAFIIVEGLVDHEKFFYRRYDFVVKDVNKSALKKGPGLVILKEDIKTYSDYDEDQRTRYFWTFIMKDSELEEGCHGASWIISPAEAQMLHDAVLADEKNPPEYQIMGENSIIASSSFQSGHNCFSWARTKIKNLTNNQNIQHDDRLQPKLPDFIAARTTLYLKPPSDTPEPVSPSCMIL